MATRGSHVQNSIVKLGGGAFKKFKFYAVTFLKVLMV